MLNSIKLSLIEKSSFKLHFSKLASNVLYHAFSTSTTNLNDNNNEHKKEETMHEIRARIFGYHIGNGLRSGRKILKKAMIGPRIANYYLKPIKDPLMMDIVQERAKLKLISLKRRGKGPPKKGKGKRSTTKKGKK